MTFIISTITLLSILIYTTFQFYWIHKHEQSIGYTIAHTLLSMVISLITTIYYFGEEYKTFIGSLVLLFFIGFYISKSANKLYWEY